MWVSECGDFGWTSIGVGNDTHIPLCEQCSLNTCPKFVSPVCWLEFRQHTTSACSPLNTNHVRKSGRDGDIETVRCLRRRLIRKLQCKLKSVWHRFGTRTRTAHNHTPLIVFRNFGFCRRSRCTRSACIFSHSFILTLDFKQSTAISIPPTRAFTLALSRCTNTQKFPNFTIFFRKKVD